MKRIDLSQRVWKLETIGWIVFALLCVILIFALTEVPRSALWIVLGATVMITARLIVGTRR